MLHARFDAPGPLEDVMTTPRTQPPDTVRLPRGPVAPPEATTTGRPVPVPGPPIGTTTGGPAETVRASRAVPAPDDADPDDLC
jgi:hypothetical protein